jgi:hypothetical protein
MKFIDGFGDTSSFEVKEKESNTEKLSTEEKTGKLIDILKTPINVDKLNAFVEEKYKGLEGIKPKEISEVNDTAKEISDNIENMDSDKLDELREKYPKIDNYLKGIEAKLQLLESLPDSEKEDLIKDLDGQIKRFKGVLAEALLKESLSDKFEKISDVEQQQDTALGKTNIDITCENAKKDFKLGDVEVKKGENLYIESKIGDKSYISGQMEHMKKQIEGHHQAGQETGKDYKSVIVVSSDYRNISEDKRKDFEDYLKSKGTSIVILEKSAAEFDEKAKNSI